MTNSWRKSSKFEHELNALNNNVLNKLELYDKGRKLSKLMKTTLSTGLP